jgi:hypothetical protein
MRRLAEGWLSLSSASCRPNGSHNVGLWPDSDEPIGFIRVRLLGYSGKLILTVSLSESDPKADISVGDLIARNQVAVTQRSLDACR